MTNLMLLFQSDPLSWNWTQFGMATGAIVVLFAILWFVLKIVPGLAATYERIRLAEINVREEETKTRAKEAESRAQQANGFTELAGALGQMSTVLRDVVIEQRHATDKALLLQRVNAQTSEQVMGMVTELSEEIGFVKDALGAMNDGSQQKQIPAS